MTARREIAQALARVEGLLADLIHLNQQLLHTNQQAWQTLRARDDDSFWRREHEEARKAYPLAEVVKIVEEAKATPLAQAMAERAAAEIDEG
jgi:hypothetical protein